MGFDFSAILLAVLAAAGLILLADIFVLKPRRAAAKAQVPPLEPVLVSLARSVFPG
jgi:hypothetical protein